MGQLVVADLGRASYLSRVSDFGSGGKFGCERKLSDDGDAQRSRAAWA